MPMAAPDFAGIPLTERAGPGERAIAAKLDRIIELLELQIGMTVTAQDEADKPEEVDRGYLDG